MSVKVGCCGFRRSRGPYMKRFEAVEVQHTFYDPPPRKELAKWRSEAPPEFEFTLKAWQLITHEGNSPTYRRMKRELSDEERESCGAFRPTPVVKHALESTLESAEALGARIVLFQCPPRFVPSDENLDNMRIFFSHARPQGLRYAFEPRGKQWPAPVTKAICDELALVHAVDPFHAEPVTEGEYYLRVLGERGRGFAFSDEQLGELAETVRMIESGYVFFNHLAMLEDAARFLDILGQSGSGSEDFGD